MESATAQELRKLMQTYPERSDEAEGVRLVMVGVQGLANLAGAMPTSLSSYVNIARRIRDEQPQGSKLWEGAKTACAKVEEMIGERTGAAEQRRGGRHKRQRDNTRKKKGH